MKLCFTSFLLSPIAGLCLHPLLFVSDFVVLTVTMWRSEDLHTHLCVGCRLVCSRPAVSRFSVVLVAVLGADVFDGT